MKRRVPKPREVQRKPKEPRREKTREDEVELPPQPRLDRDSMLAFQKTAGNAAVTSFVGQAVLARAPGPLAPAQERAAVRSSRREFDRQSVRVIQMTVGTGVDGGFGDVTAQAVATFQGANALPQTGQVDQATLDVMVTQNVAAGMQDETVYLVADFFNLNITADTLTVRHDPALAANSAVAFEAGNLRVITVGTTAMTSSTSIRDAINAQLAAAPPAPPAVGPRPAILNRARERAATAFNRTKFRDRRSVLAIQGLVGTGFDARWGPDTVQRIAQLQQDAGITADGKIGRGTMRQIVTQLDANGDRNGAIRVIVDFFRLDPNGLMDISFDATVASNAETGSAQIPGPTTIRVGPAAFTQGFEGLVHTIAHEFEHVRQRRVGIQSRDIREFLGERIEILSRGMDEEDFAGFVDDAGRAMNHFDNMTAAEQRTVWTRFVEMRRKVRQRFRSAPPADQAANQPLLDRYNAAVRP
jgi:peptidoglycan hydrolase-like protein with peptidoglycan-binding domain